MKSDTCLTYKKGGTSTQRQTLCLKACMCTCEREVKLRIRFLLASQALKY